MAGNVKEWCFNEASGQRYLLGGAFNDPSYLFYEPDLRTPLDRSPENGFRTVLYTAPDESNLAAMKRPLPLPARRSGPVEPVSDTVFDAYRALFNYDPAPLDAVIEATDDTSQYWTKEKITYNAAYGNERLTAYLFLPKNVDL